MTTGSVQLSLTNFVGIHSKITVASFENRKETLLLLRLIETRFA